MKMDVLEKLLNCDLVDKIDDMTQSEAKDLLMKVKVLLPKICAGKPKRRRMRRYTYFAVCELYKGLLNGDYLDAVGTMLYLIRIDSLKHTVLYEAIYKALTDTLGE